MTEAIDVEKSYNARAVASKLRRLADALESGKPFDIQISGHKVTVPPEAIIEFEYERNESEEEIEIELRWPRKNVARA